MTAAARRTAARERQRRYRAMRRDGLARYHVVAGGDVIDLLIRNACHRRSLHCSTMRRDGNAAVDIIVTLRYL